MTEAHGKLILFGEFSVLEGGLAVGITLPCRTRFCAEETEGSVAVDRALLQRACEDSGARVPEKQLYVDATVPRTGGFGSSAAFCVALARYLHDEEGVWACAHRMERSYHGQASGVDTRLAMAQPLSVLAFCPADGEGLPLAEFVTLPPLYLVVGGMPRRYSTKEAISRVTYSPELVAELSSCAKAALAESVNTEALGKLAQAAHDALRRLGLHDDGIDDVLREGLRRGALGGKISGAGGAFFLLCADEETASCVQDAVAPVLQRYGGVGPWIMNPGA